VEDDYLPSGQFIPKNVRAPHNVFDSPTMSDGAQSIVVWSAWMMARADGKWDNPSEFRFAFTFAWRRVDGA
jgi:hypothetical protein